MLHRPLNRVPLVVAFLLLSAGLFAVSPAAHQQTDTWQGNSDNTWATGPNWVGGNSPPVSGDALVFGAAGTTGVDLNNNLTSLAFSVSGITFNPGAAAFVIGDGTTNPNVGNPFTLAGSITNSSTSLETINNPFTLAGTEPFTTTAGGGNIALGGVIGGGGGLTLAGGGTLLLTASNTFSGPTNVTSGTLNVGNAGALLNSTVNVTNNNGLFFGTPTATLGGLSGAGNLNLNNTLVTVGNNGANTTYSGVISSANASATSGFIKTGSGTTTLANASTYAGPTVISAGTLKLAGNVFSDIGIKFNTVTALPGPAGVVPMTNWNQEPAGTAAQATAQALINSSGAASGASATWNAPATYNTGAPTTQNGYLLYSYLNQAAAGTETATVSNLPSSYTASGYTVYVYYNSNNGNAVTLNITGGSATYGVCTANVATFVLSNGSSAATQVAGDYVEWSGMSVPTFTASLTQATIGAGICGIEIVPANMLPAATPLSVASGATFDLGGANQQVASLSDYAPGLGGTVQNSNSAAYSVLTLSNTGGSSTFSGVIAGGGTLGSMGLVVAGSGVQVLAGSNTYVGGTTISSGTLQIGDGGASGSLSTGTAAAIIDNGTLVFNNSGTVTQGTNFSTAAITGSGRLIQQGPGRLVLTTTQAYTGGTTVNGGTLQLNASSSFPANTLVTVNAGATLLGNAQDNLYATGCDLVINDGTYYQASAANRSSLNLATMTGGTITSGATSADANGNICINGTVTATSDSAGNPALINATLVGLNAGAGGSIFNVTRGPGAVDLLITSNIIDTTFNPTTPLVKNGNGILVLAGSSNYSGGTTINGGTLQMQNAAALGSATGNLAVNAGLLDLNGNSLSVNALSGSGSGTIDSVNVGGALTLTVGNGGGSGSFSGTIRNTSGTLALVMAGAGVQVLAGANTYTGGTTVSAGTLQLGNGTINGSVLGNILDNAALAFGNGAAQTYSGVISGGGGLIEAGPGRLVLTASETYLGPTTISAGTLQLGNGGASGSLSAGAAAAILDNGTLAFNLSGVVAQGTNFSSAAITGSGSLVQAGPGVLVLTVTNGFTGGTTVNGGSLQLNVGGATGTLAPGSLVTVNSGATLVGNATDPLSYGGNAVTLTIQGGGRFYENNTFRASLTTLNMTGGTISSGATGDGSGANGTVSVNGVWTGTSDAAGNPALIQPLPPRVV